jgi:hypothetical protein
VRLKLVILVGGAALTASACGANAQGGSHGKGQQDVVGSALAGQCVSVNDPQFTNLPYFYCGPYAKQWCKDHPGVVPNAGGFCDGVRGWTVAVPPGSGTSGSSPPTTSGHYSGGTPTTVQHYYPAPSTTSTTYQSGGTTSTTSGTNYGGGNGYVP